LNCFFEIEGLLTCNSIDLIGIDNVKEIPERIHAFWANTAQDEGRCGATFLERLVHCIPTHSLPYGSYEPRAMTILSKRHGTEEHDREKRPHQTSMPPIYGKVYFLSVKRFVEGDWQLPWSDNGRIACFGCSLVWRVLWDETSDTQYQVVVTYNHEIVWR